MQLYQFNPNSPMSGQIVRSKHIRDIESYLTGIVSFVDRDLNPIRGINTIYTSGFVYVSGSTESGALIYTSGIVQDLSGLNDIVFTSLTNNDLIQYNSSTQKWNNRTLPQVISGAILDNIGDVNIASPTNNMFIKRDSATSSWVGITPSQASNLINIEQLSGVTLTGTPSNGQVLLYESGVWTNNGASGILLSLDNLTDVAITSSKLNDVVAYNGSNYVNASGYIKTKFNSTQEVTGVITPGNTGVIATSGLIVGVGNLTIPANQLKVGSRIKISLGSGTENITTATNLKFYIGSDFITENSMNYNTTIPYFNTEVEIIIKSIGVSGTWSGMINKKAYSSSTYLGGASFKGNGLIDTTINNEIVVTCEITSTGVVDQKVAFKQLSVDVVY